MTSIDHIPGVASRVAVAVILGGASLAACADAPTAALPMDAPAVSLVPAQGTMLSLVDDATNRLGQNVPADAPLAIALATLRSAVSGSDVTAATAALRDAAAALELTREAATIDPADRDAVALHLMVVRSMLASAEAR